MRLSEDNEAAIRSLALATPDVEVCGLLIATHRAGEERLVVVPVSNVHERPAVAYEMNTAEALTAIQAAVQEDASVWGIYHSHVDTPPIPSPTDDEFWQMGEVMMVIYSVESDELRCYRRDHTDALVETW